MTECSGRWGESKFKNIYHRKYNPIYEYSTEHQSETIRYER